MNKPRGNRDLIKLRYKTAKNGFRNKQDVIDRFNDWKHDKTAKAWLNAMSYHVSDIKYVKASKVRGQYKGIYKLEYEL